ncbi:hypothetical protein M422DRAFT_261240 [Sphaerobolus stellatus SS14]|uniref:Uncharacterized protein n=1 Tax=Sphaerobolus stellatus (strain SS14) TaxID=990650 RepID=A0A0C9VGL3_SPHS4|nr:hypothetical protein M422DRAFT_261240 [Sphaerobolus stellatus SS14]
MAYERLAEILASLVVKLKEVKARLHKLEYSLLLLPAKPAAPSPSAHTSGVVSHPRKGQLAAPTSTPTKGSSTALPGINSLSSKAAFEKTVITLSIPDEQVGKAGTGLKCIQSKDFCGTSH